MFIRTAHKILITAAILLFVFYAIWEIRGYPEPRGAWALFRGIISAVVAIGFGVYLWYFTRSQRLQ